jgi:MFS family permease
VTVTLVASEALAVATVLPLVARDLHGLALYGWVVSAFFLGTLVGLVIGGEEVDRRGPAAPFAASLALFASGLLTAGLAPAMWVVVAGRVLQGLGAGAIPAISYAAIGRTIPDALRPRVFAILSTAWVLPGIAGPGAAAAVATVFGWRAVFLGLLPFVLLAGAVAYRALLRVGPPDEPSEAAHRIVPALGLAAGAGLGLAALQARSLVSLVLLPAGVLVGWRPARMLFPAGTLRARPGLPATVLVRGLLIFGFFGADTFVPLSLVEVRGQSTALAGAALTSSTLAWTAAAWVQARYVLRLGPRVFVRTGLLVLVVGVASTATTLLPAVPPALAVVTWAVAGFGIGLAYSVLSLATLREADPGREGAASASLNLAENLGVAFGAGIGGAAVAAGAAHGRTAAGIAVAFAIAATVALVGVVAAANVPATTPE